MKSSYVTDLKDSMKGCEKKFYFLNFMVECLALSQFSSDIIANTKELREIISLLENYEPIKVKDVFNLYIRVINWTVEYSRIYGTPEVTSKVHKLEHFVLDTILVTNFFLF